MSLIEILAAYQIRLRKNGRRIANDWLSSLGFGQELIKAIKETFSETGAWVRENGSILEVTIKPALQR